MKQVCGREQCTGCGLCSNICPKNAINMRESFDTGHFIPEIDQDKCIDCHKCEKKCPSLKEFSRQKAIKTYAAWRKELSKITGSSSGGVAAVFYETAIGQGYSVVGTYLNDKFQAQMKCTSNLSDCIAFRGSKYIQAKSGMVYAEALDRIKKGQKLLFIGTPCQCAAMRSAADGYMERLLTVELICHGTPPQKVFLEYIHMIAKRKKERISKVQFRSSWGGELTLSNGKKIFWKYKWNEDDFLSAFQTGVLHNIACYDCHYAYEDRGSDIAIGDFWKIGREIPFVKPSCKVSVVITYSQKGVEFLNSCSCIHLEERSFEEAKVGNPNLYRPSLRSQQYETFWKEYQVNGLDAAMKAVGGKALARRRVKNRMVGNIKKIIKTLLGRN